MRDQRRQGEWKNALSILKYKECVSCKYKESDLARDKASKQMDIKERTSSNNLCLASRRRGMHPRYRDMLTRDEGNREAGWVMDQTSDNDTFTGLF